MNIREAYFWEQREISEEAERKRMEGKKKVYEWIYKVGNEQHWHILSRLMTDSEVAIWLKDFEEKPIKYKKTGREFIVEENIK